MPPRKNKRKVDPKVKDLMAAINDKTEQIEEEKEKISHPPTTYKEFLFREKIPEWPYRLTSEGKLDLSVSSDGGLTKDFISAELSKSASYGDDDFEHFQESLNEFEKRLTEFSSMFNNPEVESLPSRLSEGLFHAPRKEYLVNAANSDAVKLHPSYSVLKKDMKQTLQEEAQALKTRDISYVAFPGFRSKELTELPSQLEAPQLLNKVTEAQAFNKGFLPLWKKLFLSEASAAILQDAFWWLFLEMFESYPEAQDKIYTRLAGSYIALFNSVHADIRDKFFTEYPRCLSQAVYLTFYEAFPESHDRFGEEFLSEICCHIHEWVSGVKPPVGHWKFWPFKKLFSLPEASQRKTLTPFDNRQIIKSRADLPTSDSMRFDIKDIISASSEASPNVESLQIANRTDDVMSPEMRKSIDSAVTRQSIPKQENKLKTVTDSTPAGPGPEMERVRFNISGKSPLVSHFLYIKNLKEKNVGGRVMKRTEVVRKPPPGVTFNDVIRESKKSVKTLHDQRKKSDKETEIYIRKLHHEHRKAMQKINKAGKVMLDPVNLKLRSDKIQEDSRDKAFIGRGNKNAGSTPTSVTTCDMFE